MHVPMNQEPGLSASDREKLIRLDEAQNHFNQVLGEIKGLIVGLTTDIKLNHVPRSELAEAMKVINYRLDALEKAKGSSPWVVWLIAVFNLAVGALITLLLKGP